LILARRGGIAQLDIARARIVFYSRNDRSSGGACHMARELIHSRAAMNERSLGGSELFCGKKMEKESEGGFQRVMFGDDSKCPGLN
jgi:hypothetical protein